MSLSEFRIHFLNEDHEAGIDQWDRCEKCTAMFRALDRGLPQALDAFEANFKARRTGKR